MATATSTVTLSTDVNTLWKKEQGGLFQGWQFEVEEWDMLDDLQRFNLLHSTREVTAPIDLQEEVGVASIAEGGYEARTGSVKPIDATFTFVIKNMRFTISHLVRQIDTREKAAQISNQFRYQGTKKLQAGARVFGYEFHGYSNGYLCQTSTNATQSSGTYTLLNAFGNSNVNNAAYIGGMIKVGDWVALVRAGALVTNAIGRVTAVTPGTPSIAVTWNGSVDSDANDYVVFANSIENTTIDGTSYNRHCVGLLDALFSTSVHGISGSTYPNWTASNTDLSSGRFSSQHIMKMQDEIRNRGGGKMTDLYFDQGVWRDLMDNKLGAIEFSDPLAMQMEGQIQSKNLRTHRTQRTPPGFVIGTVKSSHRRWQLVPKPNQPMWGDGDKIEGKSAYAFSMEFPIQTVYTNRANLASYYNCARVA